MFGEDVGEWVRGRIGSRTIRRNTKEKTLKKRGFEGLVRKRL